jgi:hypothetical protein
MVDPSLAIRLVLGLYRFVRRRVRIIGSTSWPMADGKIFGGKVQQGDIPGWSVLLTYSYSALGEYYSGTFYKGFGRKKSAEAFLQRFPSGTPLPIRYKAESPEISTLLASDLGLLLAGL